MTRWGPYVASDGTDRVGYVDGDRVRGLASGVTMLDVLDGTVVDPGETVALDGLMLRAPLQRRRG